MEERERRETFEVFSARHNLRNFMLLLRSGNGNTSCIEWLRFRLANCNWQLTWESSFEQIRSKIAEKWNVFQQNCRLSMKNCAELYWWNVLQSFIDDMFCRLQKIFSENFSLKKVVMKEYKISELQRKKTLNEGKQRKNERFQNFSGRNKKYRVPYKFVWSLHIAWTFFLVLVSRFVHLLNFACHNCSVNMLQNSGG